MCARSTSVTVGIVLAAGPKPRALSDRVETCDHENSLVIDARDAPFLHTSDMRYRGPKKL